MNTDLNTAVVTLNETNIESNMTMPNSNQITITPVQNGTEIMSSNLSKYIAQYNSFARKTAESIIQLARTLIEAKNDLDPIEFETFTKKVNVDVNSSTYKKLMVIGNKASRFEPYYNKLPQSWTTIYRLAQIEPHQFERLASNNVITPFMTAKMINEQIDVSKAKKASSTKHDVNINLKNLDTSSKSEIYKMLYALRNKFNFELDIDASVTAEISEYRQTVAA
jgi:hypothetical protein